MGVFANLRMRLSSDSADDSTRLAVAHAIQVADPRMALVGRHERKLAPVVGKALDYCRDLVETIPGPVEIDAQTFGSDPLVHALFATPADIGRMLGASAELARFCTSTEAEGAEAVYAMIGMRRREKLVLSPALKGDLIQVDVPRRLLYFADHTLHEPSADLGLTRTRLRDAAFDSLVRSFAAKLSSQRAEHQDVRSEWEQERALSRFGAEAAAHDQRRVELERQLREAVESFEPAHVLDALVAWLEDPQSSLRLDEVTVTIDPLGTVVSDGAATDNAHTLRLPILVGRDRRRWIVMMARIPRQEAREARHEAEVYKRTLTI